MGLPWWLSGKRIHLPMQKKQETWFQSLGREDSLEKEMATHSSILAWKISWTEEPAGLQSMGLPRVSGKESACQCRRCRRHGFNSWVGKIPWRRKWKPTPVFLPRKLHEQRSLEGCSPWGRKESDTTDRLNNNNNLDRYIQKKKQLTWEWSENNSNDYT